MTRIRVGPVEGRGTEHASRDRLASPMRCVPQRLASERTSCTNASARPARNVEACLRVAEELVLSLCRCGLLLLRVR